MDTLNGTAAVVCFPGVMYRGGAEQKIRKYLIDNNYVECGIQLPDNLFFGTSIATCIMVLKKNKVENSTLFIDASKELSKDGKKGFDKSSLYSYVRFYKYFPRIVDSLRPQSANLLSWTNYNEDIVRKTSKRIEVSEVERLEYIRNPVIAEFLGLETHR